MWKDSNRNIVVIFQPNILRIVGFYVRHSAFDTIFSWCTDVKNIREIDILWWLPELHTSKIGQTIWAIWQLSCLSAALQSNRRTFISFIFLPSLSWLELKERSQPTKSFLICETFIWKYISPFLALSVQGSNSNWTWSQQMKLL